MRPSALWLAVYLAVYLAMPAAAHATELAPYFWTWGGGAAATLVDAQRKAGLQTATLAFVTAGNGCADDGSAVLMADDVNAFRAAGGRVILSFGGQSGTYVEAACTDEDELVRLIEDLLQKLGTNRIDFDVEGAHLADREAGGRRTRALRRLQEKHPDLSVSLTLPVAPDGLPPQALDLVNRTVASGVRIDVVNIMTMDYGGGSLRGLGDLGATAIRSAEATVAQLRKVYPGKSVAELYGLLGITPMIGRNDDGTTFTLKDARRVTAYAREKGIGRLSFWAVQRDQPGNDLATSSATPEKPFAFSQAFGAEE